MLALQHGPEQIHRVFRFGVIEVVGPHQEILILRLLLLVVRHDQERFRSHPLGDHAIGIQDEVQRIVERHLLEKDRNRFVSHVFIEDHIQARRPCDDFEDLFELGVLESERNGLAGSAEHLRGALLCRDLGDVSQGLRQMRIEFDRPFIGREGFLGTAQVEQLIGHVQLIVRFLQSERIRHARMVLHLRRVKAKRGLKLSQGVRDATLLQCPTSIAVMGDRRLLLGGLEFVFERFIERVRLEGIPIGHHGFIPFAVLGQALSASQGR